MIFQTGGSRCKTGFPDLQNSLAVRWTVQLMQQIVRKEFFFVTQEWTPHFLRFCLYYTVMVPAAPQETVGEAGIEPGLLRDSLVSASGLNH
jgi:hypothetical protein